MELELEPILQGAYDGMALTKSNATSAAWSLTYSRQFHRNFISHEKLVVMNDSSGPKFTKDQTFLSFELSHNRKNGSTSSKKRELLVTRRDCNWIGNALCCGPKSQSCARARSKELDNWFCSDFAHQSIAFWKSLQELLPVYARWPARARTWTQKVELCHCATWPLICKQCKGFICSEIPV